MAVLLLSGSFTTARSCHTAGTRRGTAILTSTAPGTTSKDFLLEVYASDGDLIASQPADFPRSQEWQQLAVDFYTDSPTVTFRLTYVFFFSESATFLLDDARLMATSDPDASLGFEEGTLDGWSLVDSGDGGFDAEVVSPGLVGNFSARITSSGEPEDGLQRTIDPGENACSIRVLATGGSGATALLRVTYTDNTGQLVSQEDRYTFTGAESAPIGLGVGAQYFPSTEVTVQLLNGGTTSTTAVVTFDGLDSLYCF